MEELRIHYSITATSSTKFTDRYSFSALTQSQSDTIQSWEIQVHQAGSLCEYEKMTDELCRDKFIFGLHDKFTDIRTNLLKPDKNFDGSVTSLSVKSFKLHVFWKLQHLWIHWSQRHIRSRSIKPLHITHRVHHKHHVQRWALKIWNAYHTQNWTWNGNPTHPGTVGAINHTHGNSAPRAIKSVPNVVTWIILHQYVNGMEWKWYPVWHCLNSRNNDSSDPCISLQQYTCYRSRP